MIRRQRFLPERVHDLISEIFIFTYLMYSLISLLFIIMNAITAAVLHTRVSMLIYSL